MSERPTIGLLIYGAEDPTCRALWSGVDRVARDYDVNVFSFRAEPLHIPEEFLAQANVLYEIVSTEQLDGLVVWGGVLAHYVSQEEVLALLDDYAGMPLVNISSQLPDVPNVLIDNYQGTYDAVTHLVDAHGAQRIAFVRGPEGHVEAESRYRGYRHALRDHGLEFDPARVAPGDFSRKAGLESVRLLVDERGVTLDAVLTANDQLAIDVMAGLQARGLRVPNDVAVIGFDNRPECRFLTPPLTTIDQPWSEMGRQAAELLVQHLLEGRALTPDIVKVPPRLVVRESCGCPPRSIRRISSPTLPTLSEAAPEPLQLSESERARTLRALTDTAPGLSLQNEAADLDLLLTAWANDVQNTTSTEFLSKLKELLRFSVDHGDDVSQWHTPISVMRQELLGTLTTVAALVHAEQLWQQAQVMIGDWFARAQANARLARTNQQETLTEIGELLSTSVDVTELMARVTQALERLGIPRCYLSLYEEPSAPAEWSRLRLAYAEGRDFSHQGAKFPSPQLLPPALVPTQRFSLHVEPLYFRAEQLGFVLFEAEPRRGEVYDILRRDISRALYSSLVLERSERRAAQIQTAAEVAQATGQILDPDLLIQRVVNLVQTRFDLYYVGLFLVDEAGTWANLRAGTGTAGEEMVAAGHKLEVGGNSMIGQCVAEQEAHIALDVGEEAVRFENPWLPETRSEMALPLVSRGESIGALTIQSSESAAFGQLDINSLQVMADQLANALANARLYEQAQMEIAERRRTEKALAQQEYLLRVLLDGTPDHVFFKDRESRFIEVSQALVNWFAVEDRELIIGKTDFEFFSEEHARSAYEDEQQVIETGEPILNKEEKETWPDGSVTWASTTKMPMRDPDGEISGIFGVSRDITALKEAMAEQERLLHALEKRSEQLQVAASVAQTVTSILESDTLPQRVASIVRDRFGLYYVGLFLVAEASGRFGDDKQWIVLRGATGEAGKQMLEDGYRLAVDDASTVGTCIIGGKAQIVLDIEPDETTYLPDTRSELVLPLISRGRSIGALMLQSTDPYAFTDEDMMVFQTMAGQITVAIENARLLEQAQTALADMEATQQRYVQQAWDEYLETRGDFSYYLPGSTANIADERLRGAIQDAIQTQSVVVLASDGQEQLAGAETLVVPAIFRGQPIGALAIQSQEHSWTVEEISLARLLAERMALIAENLRLFEESQATAARERLLSEVASRVRERLDVETVLRTAADEIYQALDLESVTVRLTDSQLSQHSTQE